MEPHNSLSELLCDLLQPAMISEIELSALLATRVSSLLFRFSRGTLSLPGFVRACGPV